MGLATIWWKQASTKPGEGPLIGSVPVSGSPACPQWSQAATPLAVRCWALLPAEAMHVLPRVIHLHTVLSSRLS